MTTYASCIIYKRPNKTFAHSGFNNLPPPQRNILRFMREEDAITSPFSVVSSLLRVLHVPLSHLSDALPQAVIATSIKAV